MLFEEGVCYDQCVLLAKSNYGGGNGEAPYSQEKQDQELTVAQIMNSLLPKSDLN